MRSFSNSSWARQLRWALQIAPRTPLFLWGLLLLLAGLCSYSLAILLAIVRLPFGFWSRDLLVGPIQNLLWYSGVPSTVGALFVLIDLLVFFPFKRRGPRCPETREVQFNHYTVLLTAYNDEESIQEAVKDFQSHPLVKRVIVVSNNSRDRTEECAKEAGAVVVNESRPGYGHCVFRCFKEALRYNDSTHIALCEGDRTFRAFDLDKFSAYLPHAEIVNGTRIVEQLRAYTTQLSTFMYYGNFFVGKLLEFKHLGQGTFTDVGTTYKVVRRESLQRIITLLDPCVNLEFNCHFLDMALAHGFSVVECPITFHARVGVSKGGNVNNWRALKVGCRMVLGLCLGWKHLANENRADAIDSRNRSHGLSRCDPTRGLDPMKHYHDTRLAYDSRRHTLWKALCDYYFQRFVGAGDCVLELGAGYGDFINQIRCRRRIAIDLWQGMLEHLQPGVEGHIGSATDLEVIEDSSVDFVFASNLFEHLPQAEFAKTLQALRAKMKTGATLNILQPNYRFAYREYFDDYTHVTVYSDRSLADFLEVNGFQVAEVHPRFLPLTIKSRLPVSETLVRLYLALPLKPMGKQMLIRAVARAGR